MLADHLGRYSAFAVPNREQPVALLATLHHPAGPLHVMASCVEWEPEFADDHLDYVLARPGRKPAGQRPDRVPDRAWVGRSHNDALVGCMV